MNTEGNAIEDLEPAATHADAVRGGADEGGKPEKKSKKPTKPVDSPILDPIV
jgi:hypothetical protein